MLTAVSLGAWENDNMKNDRKQPVLEKVQPEKKKMQLVEYGRNGIFSLLLMMASVLAVRHTMGTATPQTGLCLAAGLIALGCMAGGTLLKKKVPAAGMLWLLPWVLLLIAFRPVEWIYGFQGWINQMLEGWNATYEGGAALFQIQSTVRDQMAITMILICVCAELSWKLVAENRIFFCALFCFAMILLQMLTGNEQLRSCLWLLFILLALLIADGEAYMTERTLFWEAALCLVFVMLSILLPQKQMQSVQIFRTQVQQKVQEYRYGVQSLPKGDLNQASSLKANAEEMMTVQTGQEKNLYLRGFTGGSYNSASGKWESLTDADYGNENSGMLKWLKKQNFDPLTQTAQYYQLCGNAGDREENQLKIHITGAQREYLYLPCSLESVKMLRASEEKDTGLRSRGLRGIRNYEFKELSGFRPAELTMAENWVSSPKTEEQKQYLDAEAVYRNFVYEQETEVEDGLRDLIQKLFWSDYEIEQDGIYSALAQIRAVLKQPADYAKKLDIPENDADPVSWFLTGDHAGNDMFYASAAVLAFRVHGIPARYAEGYYISEDAIKGQPDGTVSVTGQDAHAWVEVYFDGIGWLPLDVTPGYYYEAVELQQMVSTPDTVRKTAALEHDQSEADPVAGENKMQPSVPEKVVKYTGLMLLGIGSLLLIAVTIMLIVRKLAGWFRDWIFRRTYQKAGNRVRIQMLHDRLYQLLAEYGITARLGWQTEETDRLIAEKIEEVKPGMYQRACSLMEKSIYGEMDLEPFEERTLQLFLTRVSCNIPTCFGKKHKQIKEKK